MKLAEAEESHTCRRIGTELHSGIPSRSLLDHLSQQDHEARGSSSEHKWASSSGRPQFQTTPLEETPSSGRPQLRAVTLEKAPSSVGPRGRREQAFDQSPSQGFEPSTRPECVQRLRGVQGINISRSASPSSSSVPCVSGHSKAEPEAGRGKGSRQSTTKTPAKIMAPIASEGSRTPTPTGALRPKSQCFRGVTWDKEKQVL